MNKPGGANRLPAIVAVAVAIVVIGLVVLLRNGGEPEQASPPNAGKAEAPAKTAPKAVEAASETPAAAPKAAEEPVATASATDSESMAARGEEPASDGAAPAVSGDDREAAASSAASEAAESAGETANEPASPELAAEKADGEAPNHAPEAAEPPAVEAADPASPAAPETASAPAPDASPVEQAPAPEFDIVRIEKSGAGLVAGRAPADSLVRITNDGVVVGETTAGADGAFVAFIQIDPAARAQGVSAQVLDPGEAGDADKPPASEAAPLVVLSGASPDAAPVVVQPDDDGVRVIQPALARSDEVTLDTISYDEAGRVVFAGRGSSGLEVRFFLDGRHVGGARIADDRSWRGQAAERLAPGVYTLAIEERDAAGAVVSRLETPFRRELIEQGALGQNRLTVQRGNSLWRIARKVYGQGVRYTLIFEANADKIEDPDLIYPGQIFTIPDTN